MDERNEISATDEELVEMHKKARKKRKRRLTLTIVIVVAAVVIALAIVIVALRNRVDEAVGSANADATSAEVTTGSIKTTVSGSGTLTDEDVDDVNVPASLDILRFYVEEGDVVEEGDLIATVTSSSLMGAMSNTQDAIDDLDERLAEAAGDKVSDTVEAGVSGRVKSIFVSSGDDVATAMYRSGALMYLSLDGTMAVEIETDRLNRNDEVTVTTGSGAVYDGTVRSSAGGQATILLTDDGPLYGDEVTVSTKDGETIGTGTLYIHSPMAVTGYTGKVSTVEVSENEEVSEGTILLTLTDTETSANYDTLLVEREDLENRFDTLIHIYRDGGICAEYGGTIVSIDDSLTGSSSSSSSHSRYSELLDLLGSSESDDGDVTVATVSRDENMIVEINVDEMDILSVSLGQKADVTIESIGDESYEGTVTYISTTPSSSSGVTSYETEITIPKTDEMLSGMSADVLITIEGVEDALVIPVEALHQTSSTAYVYTKFDEDTGEFYGMVEVTAGLSNDRYVEITSGLSEGDVVWYTPSEESRLDMIFGEGGEESADAEEAPGGDGER